ncbi:T9SS type A sorting domain-containing protein [candidate division KSB1 bacterium]|nr:T9SS type A sorting domain-containing protein [candidate division KSB1 bacterium]
MSRTLWILLIVCSATAARADSLRVMTYNVLNFRGDQDMDRVDDVRRVVEWVRPDVVCHQEIITEEAVDVLLSFAYLQVEDDWAAAEFHDGPDTDNAFFYRTSQVRFISQRIIPTSLRDIAEYTVQPLALDTAARIRLYSGHLKASSGTDNEQRRRDEAAALRQQLNMLPAGSMFMVMGDFNLYTSDEPAYQLLLDPDPNPLGQLFDPIDRPGDWNNSATFADIHTQSPRVESFGGGSTGGMDDRFDFILVSSALLDTVASYVLPATYRAVGNDGQHFNESINAGVNFAVPDSVADALYYAADHLPVQVDLLLRDSGTSVTPPREVASSVRLVTCYPNPFNPSLTVALTPLTTPAQLQVFDLLGRLVSSRELGRGTARDITLDFSGRAAGSYIVQLKSQQFNQAVRVQLVK